MAARRRGRKRVVSVGAMVEWKGCNLYEQETGIILDGYLYLYLYLYLQ